MDNIKNDNYYKSIIINDINKILQYTNNISYEEFADNEQLIDAVLFRLVQIVENIKKLSESFKQSHKEVEWNEIIGFRNRIVHDYGRTDYSIVYEVVSNDLEVLMKSLG